MNTNNLSLPYPVLGISDDVLPLLPKDCVVIDVNADLRRYLFSITLKMDNPTIEALIKSGNAEYSCEYECSKTMLRRCRKSESPVFEIELSKWDVCGRINFNCFVSVKKPIVSYKNPGFNADYADASFDMQTGDILAVFPNAHFDADIKYDKLQAAGSFMQIRETENYEDVFFDIAGDKIEILLPKKLYELYCNPVIKGSAELIHSSLVLNALTYALNFIDDHKETTWAKTIMYRLNTESELSLFDIEDPTSIPLLAQKLLKSPYLRMFNKLITSKIDQEE